MNELAMNLAAERVHNGYFEVFIVSQAAVADVLCKLLAVQDRFGVALELDANQVPHRNAVFHIEEECLHGQSATMWVSSQAPSLKSLRREVAT
jgi:hypothetical protein